MRSLRRAAASPSTAPPPSDSMPRVGRVEPGGQRQKVPEGDVALERVFLPRPDRVAYPGIPTLDDPVLDGRRGQDAAEALGAAGEGVGRSAAHPRS